MDSPHRKVVGVGVVEEARRSCIECRTTTTPMWRGGPTGPRSLCNACGIRYRKKRRQELGLDQKQQQSHKDAATAAKESHSSSSSSSSSNTNLQVVQKRRVLMGVEEAALLLMALSSSSVPALLHG